MATVRLISWDEADGRRRAGELEAEGLQIKADAFATSGLVRQFAGVAVVCIDLDRLPAHGREIAVALRRTKATQRIPLVFAGGRKDKVARIKKELPDAVYADWPKVAAAIRKLLRMAKPVTAPVVPVGHMERYSGSSLVKKLGFEAGMRVGLLGAPEGFVESLADLPEGVTFGPKVEADTRLAMWFVRDRAELYRELGFLSARLAPASAIWIVYPKKTGRHRTNLTQGDVRAAALELGLVDYKICAVDADWTGMKFTWKRTTPKAAPRRKSE